MKIILAGGRGHIGALLRRELAHDHHDVVVLSRDPRPMADGTRVTVWNGAQLGAWVLELEDADVVINLAGCSVDCRYTPRNLGTMLESRLQSTTAIGRAIAAAHRPPRIWLQMSTATIYAHRYDAPHDEATGVLGGNEPGAPPKWNASIAIARAWEEAAQAIATPHTRQVRLRTAMVMSPDSGSVFDRLAQLARRGVGGRIGDGRQYVSWIHGDDFAAAVRFLIARDDLAGTVNVCAPQPLPNQAFMQALRAAVNQRFGLPTPAWMLEFGCWLLRTESELVLKSRRVVPGRLSAAGFTFAHPTWPEAAADLARVR